MDRDRIIVDRKRMTFREDDAPDGSEIFDELVPDVSNNDRRDRRLFVLAAVLLVGLVLVAMVFFR